jgi:hypothetical protein
MTTVPYQNFLGESVRGKKRIEHVISNIHDVFVYIYVQCAIGFMFTKIEISNLTLEKMLYVYIESEAVSHHKTSHGFSVWLCGERKLQNGQGKAANAMSQ